MISEVRTEIREAIIKGLHSWTERPQMSGKVKVHLSGISPDVFLGIFKELFPEDDVLSLIQNGSVRIRPPLDIFFRCISGSPLHPDDARSYCPTGKHGRHVWIPSDDPKMPIFIVYNIGRAPLVTLIHDDCARCNFSGPAEGKAFRTPSNTRIYIHPHICKLQYA